MTRLEENLVSTKWLAAQLGAPDLRILDCTVFLYPPGEHSEGFGIESGRGRWIEEHIPGAGFADLTKDLSDQSARLPFMAPPPEQFAEAMSRYGAGEGTRVVCYDRGGSIRTARPHHREHERPGSGCRRSRDGRLPPLRRPAARVRDGRRSRAVTYCGGGIAASSAALLTLLGHDDVAVYDGSLSEWAADPSLPMAVG